MQNYSNLAPGPMFFKWEVKGLVAQPCLTFCEPMDESPPGPSVHGILQEKIVGSIAIPFFSGFSWRRDRNQVSCTTSRFLTIWAIREALCSLGSLPHFWNIKSRATKKGVQRPLLKSKAMYIRCRSENARVLIAEHLGRSRLSLVEIWDKYWKVVYFARK